MNPAPPMRLMTRHSTAGKVYRVLLDSSRVCGNFPCSTLSISLTFLPFPLPLPYLPNRMAVAFRYSCHLSRSCSFLPCPSGITASMRHWPGSRAQTCQTDIFASPVPSVFSRQSRIRFSSLRSSFEEFHSAEPKSASPISRARYKGW
jgi:hypothetical protein